MSSYFLVVFLYLGSRLLELMLETCYVHVLARASKYANILKPPNLS